MNPNLDEITNTAAAQKAANAGFFAGQEGQTSDFLKRYTGAIGGQESLTAMNTRLSQEAGLPSLQANAQRAEQAVYDIPNTYKTGLAGFGVNQNQLDRVTNTQTAKLAPIAQRFRDQANAAQTSVDRNLGFAQADQQKALLPFQTEQQLLSDRLAREATGHSQENENELTALVNKINSGITLSEGEKNRAQQLALSEQSYNNQLKLQEQSQKAAGPSTQIIERNGQKLLINSATGQIIQTYGNQTTPPKPTTGYFTQTNPNNSTSMQSVPTPSFKPY